MTNHNIIAAMPWKIEKIVQFLSQPCSTLAVTIPVKIRIQLYWRVVCIFVKH
jgi:hypothetical protein